jgi:hypothetical protein
MSLAGCSSPIEGRRQWRGSCIPGEPAHGGLAGLGWIAAR